MDFDHGCKNSAGNSSPLFGNRFSYAPSPYPESLYNIQSGSNSLVNLPFCNSPVGSPLPKFSPECYTGNIVSPNVRYLPYNPHFGPFIGGHRRSETRNIYPRNSQDCSIIHEKRFDSPAYNYQNVKMYPNVYKGKFDDKINFKSNPKRRKQNNLKGTPIMPRRHFPVHNIDINPHMKYNFNSLLNTVSNKEDLVNDKEEIEYSNTHINETNGAVAKQYSSAEVMSVNTDNAKTIIDNPNGTEEFNFVANGAENMTINSDSQNTPIDNSFRDELEDVGKNSIFGDTVINAVANKFGINDNADLTNCQVTHITMPENSIFNVQDMQQENAGNVDLANYFFEPIFDGKDENGENIVILVGNTDTQVVNEVNITDTSTSYANLETQDNIATQNSLTETSAETSLDSHVPEINSEIDPDMFFSHVDDYGASETVSTSKKKYLRTKQIKNRKNENTKENTLININQNTEANYTNGDFTSKPSTSRENKNNSTNVTQSINPLNSKRNCKCKKFSFRQQIPHWKRRPLWKFNQPVINMQRAYFRKFMKKVKFQNKHMVNEDFWNMYRIIVTRIGGNVLQTMYNILPALIRNCKTVQKPNDCNSKQSKKHLKVKFPAKMKKQNGSENLGI